MLAKLVFLVLVLGVCSCALLATRQLRLQCGHDIATARLRIRAHDEELARLRAAVASGTTPHAVEQFLDALGTVEPFQARRAAALPPPSDPTR